MDFFNRITLLRLPLLVFIFLPFSGSVQAAKVQCGGIYQVKPGDTLGAIASRIYGSSSQYTLIYSANSSALKTGPSSIRVGQQLKIPCPQDGATTDSPQQQQNAPISNLGEALFFAARDAEFKKVTALVQQGANVNYKNRSRETPMHAAASIGRVDILHYLHGRGASHNAVTSNGWLPLHHAVRFGHVQAAQYLIRIGSPLNARTDDNKTIIDMAYGIRNGAMVRMLQQYIR